MKRLIVLLIALVMAVSPAMAQEQNIAEQVRGTDTASAGFVGGVLAWYDAHMNYTAVTALMALESSFIPFPSEVIIPPAVYVASNPDTKSGMSLWLIVLFGTLGAMIGAFVNYYLALWLGRPIIYKFADTKLGHLCGLSPEKMQRAEQYFNDHGVVSTLVGRLIPVIRQLISIPAGLSRMNIGAFALFTFIGAAVWNCILALLGYLAYQAADPTVIEKYSGQLSFIIIVAFCLACAFFIARAIIKKRRNTGK